MKIICFYKKKLGTLSKVTNNMIRYKSNAPTKPLLRQSHILDEILWLYVASQVIVIAFFMNFVIKDVVHVNSKASKVLSYL